MVQLESLMKETGLTDFVRKFVSAGQTHYMGAFPLYGPNGICSQSTPPPHPNPNTHPQGKKRKKERVCIDGGLNKSSLLERHNFVYFNDVTINTSCPYHNFGEND